MFVRAPQTHHKHLLHSANAFAEYGAKLISHTSQEETKQRYPEQRVHNAEDPSTFCMRRDVAEACTKKKETRNKSACHAEVVHISTCVCVVHVCAPPMVVMTVPAKKKAELRSHRLLWLVSVPAGFTPERIADTTCWRGKRETDASVYNGATETRSEKSD